MGRLETKNERSEADRINDLEQQCMYLQRDFETLNQVVLEQGRQLDQIKLMLEQMGQRIDGAQTYQPPSLQDEKPPHY